MIEVNAELRVLWMNPQARDRMRGHPELVVAAGRLRARRRERDPALRDAVRWASRELQSLLPLTWAAKQACAVPLGEDDGGVPHFCWVLLEDGRALVAFDDADTVARRIAGARELYGLSPAQVRLARLIVDGQDLAASADLLHVSVNTLRTQLQRIFDKTGVRSQAALVRTLLSADLPIPSPALAIGRRSSQIAFRAEQDQPLLELAAASTRPRSYISVRSGRYGGKRTCHRGIGPRPS